MDDPARRPDRTQRASGHRSAPAETRGGGTVAVITLSAEGGAWINRGYITESLGDLRTDDRQTRLDAEIRTRFPTAVWRDKEHYLTIAEPEASTILEFGRWVLRERDVLREEAEQSPSYGRNLPPVG
ncbi:MAG: hypothetical protein IT200_11250 [Thermoleophilia bacterium]|nr:hypothetical protein [Thermoleophilia bacterium]